MLSHRHPALFALLCASALACGETSAQQIRPSIVVELADPAGAKPDDLKLRFGDVPLDDHFDLELTVHSVTPAPLTLKGFSIAGEPVAAADFSVVEPAAGTPIPARGSQKIVVRFRPTEARAYTANLEIASSDPKTPTMSVPLTGRGISSALRLLGCLTGTAANASRCDETRVEAPAELSLGKVIIGNHEMVTLVLDNRGRDAVTVTSVAFEEPDAAAAQGFVLSQLALPLVIEPGGRSFPLTFKPEEVGDGSASARLVVLSEDRNAPRIELPLVAEVAPNQAPQACLQIREVRRFDGNTEHPEPGDEVVVSPTDTLIFDGRVREGCTGDPEDGIDLETSWSFEGPDEFGRLLVGEHPLERSFQPEVISEDEGYTVGLSVSDKLGLSADSDEDGVPAEVTFKVIPREDIAVEIRWPDAKGVDLDLHVIREGGSFNTDNDCYWDNPSPGRWGPSKPRLALDDSGEGRRTETFLMNFPENGKEYAFYVHFFRDARPASEREPVEVQLRLYIQGELMVSEAVAVTLSSPCDTHLLRKVRWRDEPLVPQVSAGGPAANEGTVSGDTCTFLP